MADQEGRSRPTSQQSGSQHQDQGTPYAHGMPIYRAAGWAGILPLPKGKKASPPVGFTGHKWTGVWPTDEDLDAWAEDRPDGNIALRLPDVVLGIDVDAYRAKKGGETLAELEAQAGPLPATWTSTSREDGISRIHWFRIPAGLAWKNQTDIEVIHHGHRYAVVWPSIHPSGHMYRWYTPDGVLADRVPRIEDLAELPPAWIAVLTSAKARSRARSCARPWP
jgi:hypothetical protein